MEIFTLAGWLAIGYFFLVNLTAFVLFGVDKRRAKKRAWRIPEKTLFGAALIGGGLGAWIGIWTFRHKTKHWYFVIGIPAIALAEYGLLAWHLFG